MVEIKDGVEVYKSSEELQRAIQQTFVEKKKEGEQKQQLTDKQKLYALLDTYIDKHSKTTAVRKLAKENQRDVEYQLDLSADLVEILEKIKKELR